MPTGQLVTTTAMAVAISRPANQSAAILVIKTLMSTAPVPLSKRPQASAGNQVLAEYTASTQPLPCQYLEARVGIGLKQADYKCENSLISLVMQHFCGTIFQDGFTMVC